jgi:hypothetical protein
MGVVGASPQPKSGMAYVVTVKSVPPRVGRKFPWAGSRSCGSMRLTALSATSCEGLQVGLEAT